MNATPKQIEFLRAVEEFSKENNRNPNQNELSMVLGRNPNAVCQMINRTSGYGWLRVLKINARRKEVEITRSGRAEISVQPEAGADAGSRNGACGIVAPH